MAATLNKQNLLASLFTNLGKKYEPLPEAPDRSVLEHLLYAVCREGTTSADADKAFGRLKSNFFDWNEVRVSTEGEVEEALRNLPNAAERAKRIIALLQELFEMTFSFDLEAMHKKGVKVATKQFERYQNVNDFMVAWVTQHALGGHAIPLDEQTTRTLKRLHLLDEGCTDKEHLSGSIEHQVPKAKGILFVELLSRLTKDYCTETNPKCAACPMREECPTAGAVDPVPVPTPTPRRLKPR